MLFSVLTEKWSFSLSKQARKAQCLFNEAGQLGTAVPANTGKSTFQKRLCTIYAITEDTLSDVCGKSRNRENHLA